MQEQNVTEAENPRISSAPKSLGQVGYEAMLATATVSLDVGKWPELPWKWEDQPPSIRADWEAVALALAIEVELKARLVKEIAEQMGLQL